MSSPPIALVTGANKGIGFETARQLARRGVLVRLGARDQERGRQAVKALAQEGITAPALRLDVTDAESVQQAAEEIEREHGRLDILVNNAGVAGFSRAPSLTSYEQIRQAYETNVFGLVTVTNAMLPLLRRSAAGRIVNLSSHMGSLTLMSDPASPFAEVNLLAYQSSKAAVNAITLAYAKELEDAGIKVNAANPGVVATDMNGHRGRGTPAQGAAVVVRLAMLGPEGPTGAGLAQEGTVPW
ncbi:SDR family oxidoreductase [Kineosporia babensis]|uniref:SDR family oxidoreductase n=1 Tax=Kineosporia babensis TaxID=499548 RepID=A0A9X1SXX6_9ACTN|nr:SDR family oxidoreductase [Kineosporia babensis]MCD5315685.1 SDR family oxidoreductase [Kineosporia babensis]